MLRNCMELSDTLQFQSCVYFYVMWLCVLTTLRRNTHKIETVKYRTVP